MSDQQPSKTPIERVEDEAFPKNVQSTQKRHQVVRADFARELASELSTANAEVERLKAEVSDLNAAIPLIDGRVRNEAIKLMGESIRHDDGNGASHACVEVTKMRAVVEILIAERTLLLANSKALDYVLREIRFTPHNPARWIDLLEKNQAAHNKLMEQFK